MVVPTLEKGKGGKVQARPCPFAGFRVSKTRHGYDFRGVFRPSSHPRYVLCCLPTSQCLNGCSNGELLRLFSIGGTLLRLFPKFTSFIHLFQVVETYPASEIEEALLRLFLSTQFLILLFRLGTIDPMETNFQLAKLLKLFLISLSST